MRMRCNGLLLGLLLAAPAIATAADPAPAVAPPPPTLDDPGQPATAESVQPGDARLAPLPAESAPAAADRKPVPPSDLKSDGDPTNLPAIPTDDAFHPPPKTVDSESRTVDGYSVRVHTESNGDRIEEYRHGGTISRVKVQPAHGKAFELHDSNGDGSIDRKDAKDNPVLPVQWSLFEWH